MILPLLKTIFAEIGLKHPDTGDEGNGKVKTFIIDSTFIFGCYHSGNIKYSPTSHGKVKHWEVTWFGANCNVSDCGIATFFLNKFVAEKRHTSSLYIFAGAMNPRKL